MAFVSSTTGLIRLFNLKSRDQAGLLRLGILQMYTRYVESPYTHIVRIK